MEQRSPVDVAVLSPDKAFNMEVVYTTCPVGFISDLKIKETVQTGKQC